MLQVSGEAVESKRRFFYPFLNQELRYHCPINGIFKFSKPRVKTFLSHVWYYERGDFNLFRDKASTLDWGSLQSSDINVYADNINTAINSMATECIPSRHVQIKPLDPLWLTASLKRHIRKRKRAFRKDKRTNLDSHWKKIKKLRNMVITMITQWFGLSSVTSAKHLTVYGMSDYYINLELLVSQVKCLIGLTTIFRTESNVSFFLVLFQTGSPLELEFLKDLYWGLLYINDIITDIGSNIRLFADDTSLYIVVDDPSDAANCLNTDLDKISRWAATWLVSFNPAKTEPLLISRKLNRPQHPALSMQNHQIIEVDHHKHLGVYFSNDCTWHHHINYIKEKA